MKADPESDAEVEPTPEEPDFVDPREFGPGPERDRELEWAGVRTH